MKAFLRWLTDEKLIIVGVIMLGLGAAAYQEWSVCGAVIAGGFGYLKGRKDGADENIAITYPPDINTAG